MAQETESESEESSWEDVSNLIKNWNWNWSFFFSVGVWMPLGGAYAQKFNNSEKKLITLNWTIEQAAF